MQDSALPTKTSVPFGASATSSYINPIPIPSQIGIKNGAASFTDGFPPLTMTPPNSGGVLPFGPDFNGIFNFITLWLQWFNAGGQTPYDSAFSTAIGGYPNGAVLQAASVPGGAWVSTTDNNTTDPDTGGAGWISARAGRLLDIRIFTSGSGTYTQAAGVNSVLVLAKGGGGGGGGAPVTSSSQGAVGGGGGSGSFAIARFTTGFSSAAYSVGAGGSVGLGSAGGTGGATTFISSAQLDVPGGVGGSLGAVTTTSNTTNQGGGGAAPTGSGVLIGVPGSNGLIGVVLSPTNLYSGGGAPGVFGMATSPTSSSGNNVNAGGYGSGGGGSASYNSSTATAGGTGSAGFLIVLGFS